MVVEYFEWKPKLFILLPPAPAPTYIQLLFSQAWLPSQILYLRWLIIYQLQSAPPGLALLSLVNPVLSAPQYPAHIPRLCRRGQTGRADGETEARVRTAGHQPPQVCLLWQEENQRWGSCEVWGVRWPSDYSNCCRNTSWGLGCRKATRESRWSLLHNRDILCRPRAYSADR